MFKDKFLIRFYCLLIIVFLSLYYVGETRSRHWREMGFTLCKKNGLEMWSTSSPEEDNILDLFRSK